MFAIQTSSIDRRLRTRRSAAGDGPGQVSVLAKGSLCHGTGRRLVSGLSMYFHIPHRPVHDEAALSVQCDVFKSARPARSQRTVSMRRGHMDIPEVHIFHALEGVVCDRHCFALGCVLMAYRDNPDKMVGMQ